MMGLVLVLFGGVIVIVFLLVGKIFYRPRHPNHPLFVGPNFWTNIALLGDDKSDTAVTHYHNLSALLNGFGKTTYGSIFQVYMMTKNNIVVTDYKLARLILTGDASKDIQESEKTNLSGAFDLSSKFGSIFSSLTSDPVRQKARKFLAPSFSFSNLKYTFEILMKSLIKCNKKLEKYSKAGTVFELNDVMIKLTFDVISESAFGVEWNTQTDDVISDGNVFLHETEVHMRECARRMYNPLLKYFFWSKDFKRHNLAVERIFALLRRVVDDYRTKHSNSEMMDQSIMGHIMRHDYDDEDRRIVDMNTFLIAGHETTSHTLAMMVLILCKNPRALRNLQAELDAAIPSAAREDMSRYPSISDIRALPYLNGCIQEAMRLHPVVGIGSKRCTLNEIEYEGVVIPKGSVCTLAYYSMFRQPWIDRAEEFLPERWDASNPQEKDLKAMMMPFALGSRNCIGQNLAKVELFMISSYLLRYFEFELLSEPKFEAFLTLKANNIMVRAHIRE